MKAEIIYTGGRSCFVMGKRFFANKPRVVEDQKLIEHCQLAAQFIVNVISKDVSKPAPIEKRIVRKVVNEEDIEAEDFNKVVKKKSSKKKSSKKSYE